MGVVVVPGRFVAPANDIGRFMNTLLGVALASTIERQRWQRARQLHADGAVLRLELEPGVMTARVQGSSPEPYAVRIEVATMSRPVMTDGALFRGQASSLVPEVGGLRTSCTCPSWELPCKHVVAALLSLGDELQMRPALLLEWRCSDAAESRDASSSETGIAPASWPDSPTRPALRLAPGGGAEGPDRRDASVADVGSDVGTAAEEVAPAVVSPDSESATTRRALRAPEQAAMAHPDWPGFVGTLPIPPGPAVPDGLSLEGRQALGSIDLTAWLATAHAAMRSAVVDR